MVKNLRLLREEMGISQKKLADMLSISQQAIFKYERTSNEPDISTLIKLAEIFDVTVDFLIGNSEIRENNVKKNAVMLTEKETEHIHLWRTIPQPIQNQIDELLADISGYNKK